VRGEALRGLAAFDDPKTPPVILAVYRALPSAEKRVAIATLTSRVSYASALLDAVAAKKVPAGDIPADAVRQLRTLADKKLLARIGEVWGIVRSTPAERQKLIGKYRAMLTATARTAPDLNLGRALYDKTCARCHILFGEGGKVGPELTGSNRANLDYLLDNILDPSAVIPKEYAMSALHLKRGRVVTGIIKEQTPTAYTVVTDTETLTILRKDVEKVEASPVSMMPEDQLKPMSDAEVRSLIAYLQSPKQALPLATEENAKDFFNGKDLSGWVGDPKLWKVEKGEIVGKSPGIKDNSFLRSKMVAADFKLSLKVKLVPDRENSGVQFRSEELPGGEVRGPQADIGAGWWGKLYEEHGRGLVWKNPGDQHVRKDDWNDYVIEAVGSRVRTWINGKLCVDLDDANLARRGIFALQIHSGGPMEVRFKEMKLEVIGAKK
jgi:putative heme-binding domain-containing protein